MVDRSWTRRIALATVAGGFALALAAAPIAPGAALAKSSGSNGADHSGGKGGGKGGGQGGNSGSGAPTFVESDTDSHGKGHTGHGKGHSKDAVSGVLSSHEFEDGATSDMLGRLNAAHASPNAMLNANEDSAVGLTALYYDALAVGQEVAAAGFLADLANKEVSEDSEVAKEEVAAVVQAYNDLLGIEIDGIDGSPDTPPDTPTGSGAEFYSGFEISEETKDALILATEAEYDLDDIGGGLGPAPDPDP